MIVLDASALLELLLGTAPGRVVAHRIASRSESLHAPHVVDLEVAQVLRRFVAKAIVSESRAEQALDDFAALDVSRYAHDQLLPRIWELRANATAYDAAYLALAEALHAPLLTRDAKLVGVPGVRARVIVV